jgi:hypothetical protein
MRALIARFVLIFALALSVTPVQAQFGGRGFGGVREDAKILKRYDKDGDGMLNATERRAALSDFGFDLTQVTAPGQPAGARQTPPQVKSYGRESLYDPLVLRTLFLNFDTPTWEDELAVFKDSDVKVPAMLVVDGTSYRDVGVSFRGQTSFRITGAGQKRSFNIDLNFRHKEQQLLGNRRLTLLNAAQDPSFLRTVMYLHIARDYYAAFKANYVRVVINGENWGVYVNQQPADAVYTQAAGGSQGPVWKVPGSPGGRGGLEYWGEDPAPYQRVYDLTHKGGKSATESWLALIRLCRVLNQTPPDKLPAALAPLLDVDGTLRFLAVDNALMNGDGYFTRASDYNLYQDAQGRFHAVPHDANESFRPPEGFGGWRRRGNTPPAASSGNEFSTPPLAGADQPDKALLYRLLAVPEYKQRYLGYLRDINNKWLNWERFGPLAAKYQALIADEVRRDDHKLYGSDAFAASLGGVAAGGAEAAPAPSFGGGMFGGAVNSLRSFVEQRHAFLASALGEK